MNLPSPVAFTKMSGTGNDFIVIDNRAGLIAAADAAALARRVCRRKFSVGADGLILLENSAQADFQWRFYNADGSLAEMCGNGARCAARFAYTKGLAPESMRFMTMAGIIEAAITAEAVKVKLTGLTGLQLNQVLEIDGAARTVHFVNTGVPHVVCFVEDIKGTEVVALGRLVRHHARYQPAGTNVNFVGVNGNGGLTVRTYERGVEDETMACGTGAVAAAVIGALLGHVGAPVPVTTSGGERLLVHFELAAGGLVREVYLEGPARFIYEGQLHHEAWS